MTLPDERFRAVMQAHSLLVDLVVPQRTPRVPTAIRHRAQSALRHYPSAYDMERASDLAPQIFQDHLDPLYSMVKKYDEEKKAGYHKCNACSCEYSEDEGGIEGDFGILPMSFCPTCFSCMCDMVSQYMGYGEYSEEENNETISTSNIP